MQKTTTLPRSDPVSATKNALQTVWSYRPMLVGLLAITLAGGIWFGLDDLTVHARIVFITFSLAVIGWCFTKINQTYIALAAAIVFPTTGVVEPNEFFKALGDSMIWLLLASYVIAGAIKSSGLLDRLTVTIMMRAGSVSQLFYILTAAVFVTAFIVPSTSGRAALMLPIFTGLSSVIHRTPIVKALALLFPTTILLSAIASLIGAGAHLVTAGILSHTVGEQI